MEKMMLKKPPIGQEIKAARIEIHYLTDPQQISVTRSGEGESTVFTFTSDWQEGTRYGDPKAIRAEFEKVKTEQEALVFLRSCGPFAPVERPLPLSMFKAWQRYFRAQRLRKPVGIGTEVGSTPEGFGYGEYSHNILAVPPVNFVRPDKDASELRGFIDCQSVLEVIGAANFVDRLAGKEPRECLECRRVFEPPTKRRWYCDQKCTDLAGRDGWKIDGRGGRFKLKSKVGGGRAKAAK